MEELGLAPSIFHSPIAAALEAGKDAFETLLRGRWPAEAIIFANDNLAAGALLHGLRAKIAIPQTCAVMGFGDLSIADKLIPSLTTVRPPRPPSPSAGAAGRPLRRAPLPANLPMRSGLGWTRCPRHSRCSPRSFALRRSGYGRRQGSGTRL